MPDERAFEYITFTVKDSEDNEFTSIVTIEIGYPTQPVKIMQNAEEIQPEQSHTNRYDQGFAEERVFYIMNPSATPVELDLSALYSMEMPSGFEITQFPETTLAGYGTTMLKLRFDGSSDAAIPIAIGVTILDGEQNTPETFEFLYCEIADSNSRRVEIFDVQISGLTDSKSGIDVGTHAAITGSLCKAFSTGTTKVEFSSDMYTIVAQQLVQHSGDTFSCDISAAYAVGDLSRTVYYRSAVTIDNKTTYGQWQPYTFYLAQNPLTGALRVDDIQITSQRPEEDWSELEMEPPSLLDTTRFLPYVTGYVNGDFQSQEVLIQFAHTANAVTALETISIDNVDRFFRYDPWEHDADFSTTGTIYYRLVVDETPQAWQAWQLDCPAGDENLQFNFQNKLATKFEIDYYGNSSIRISHGYSTTAVERTAICWDTDNDGAYDEIIEYLPGQSFALYAPVLPYDVLQNIRADAYLWDETRQLWILDQTWESGDFVITDAYLNSLYQKSGEDFGTKYAITAELTFPNATTDKRVKIAIDLDEDGQADAYTYTDENGYFSYVPVGVEAGTYTVLATVCHADIAGNGTYAWTQLGSYQHKPQDISLTASLSLSSESPYSVPFFEGKVFGSTAYEDVFVEFDHNNNDEADGTAVIRADGTFTYIADGASNASIRYRIGKWNTATNSVAYTSWNAITYDFTPPRLTVSELKLNNPTIDSTRSQDPTITGKLTGVQEVGNQKVLVYINSSATADGWVYTDSNGNFTYTPKGLTLNESVAVHARAEYWDYSLEEYVLGDTASFTFAYCTATAPDSVSLSLLYDTGSNKYNRVTSIATIASQIYIGNENNVTMIDFYTKNGEEITMLGQSQMDTSQKYTWSTAEWNAAGITAGELTRIFARARVYDPYHQTWIEGTESYLDITYDPNEDTPATFSTTPNWFFQADPVNSRPTTATPYIYGAINDDGDKTLVSVEFRALAEGSSEYVPLGSAACDSNGQFLFYAKNLPAGNVTIEYRIVEQVWNSTTEVRAGSWQAWNVHYASPSTPLPEIVPGSLAVYNNADDSRIFSTTDNPFVLGKIHLDDVNLGIENPYADIFIEYCKVGEENNILGMTAIDSSGYFVVEILNAISGDNRYQFRCYQQDSPTNTPVYGQWAAVQFRWTASAEGLRLPEVLPFNITNISLDDDYTSSAQDGFTSNPYVYVEMFRPENSSITIEIDSDGDGKSDSEVSASYYTASTRLHLSVDYGANTVYFRAKMSEEDGVQYSEWTPLSFVYYGSSSSNLTEAEALQLYGQWMVEAEKIHQNILQTRNQSLAELKETVKAAEKTYLLSNVAQEDAYQSTSTKSLEEYQGILTDEQLAYELAMQNAESTLNDSLAQLSGDPNFNADTFTFEDFSWGTLPDDYRFIFPSDNPPPPEYPSGTYDYPNLDEDFKYALAMQRLEESSQKAQTASAHTYAVTISSLEQTLESSNHQAQMLYLQTQREAENQYELELQRKLAEIETAYQRDTLTLDYINTSSAIEASYYQKRAVLKNTRDTQLENVTRSSDWYMPRDKESLYRYHAAKEKINHEYDLAIIDLLAQEEMKLAVLNKEHQLLQFQYDYDKATVKIELQKILDAKLNTAKHFLEESLAQYKAVYDQAAAKAEKENFERLAIIEMETWNQEAQVYENAIRRFYGSTTSPEAIYEIALAETNTAYEKYLSDAWLQYRQKEITETYHNKSATISADLKMLIGDTGRDGLKGKIDFDLDRSEAVTDAEYLKQKATVEANFLRESAKCEQEYDARILGKELTEQQKLIECNMWYAWTMQTLDTVRLFSEGYYMGDLTTEEWNVLSCRREFDYQNDNDILRYQYSQEILLQTAPCYMEGYDEYLLTKYTPELLDFDYELACDDANYVYANAVTEANKLYELACLSVEYVYAETVTRLQKNLDDTLDDYFYHDATSITTDELNVITNFNSSEEIENMPYETAWITAEHIMQNIQATAWYDYQVALADEYMQAMEQWRSNYEISVTGNEEDEATKQYTPWATYQYALAEAAVTWEKETLTLALNDAIEENVQYANAQYQQSVNELDRQKEINRAGYEYDVALAAATYVFERLSAEAYYTYEFGSNSVKWIQERTTELHKKEWENERVKANINRELGDEQVTAEYSITIWETNRQIHLHSNETWYLGYSSAMPSETVCSIQQAAPTLRSYKNTVVNDSYNFAFAAANAQFSTNIAQEEYNAVNSLAQAAENYYRTVRDQSVALAAAWKNAEIAYATATAEADCVFDTEIASVQWALQQGLNGLQYAYWRTEFAANWAYDDAVFAAEKAYETALYAEYEQTLPGYETFDELSAYDQLRYEALWAEQNYSEEAWQREENYQDAMRLAQQVQLEADITNESTYRNALALQQNALDTAFADIEKSRSIAIATAVANRDMLEWNAELQMEFQNQQREIAYDLVIAEAILQRDKDMASTELAFQDVYCHRYSATWIPGKLTYDYDAQTALTNAAQKQKVQKNQLHEQTWLKSLGEAQIARVTQLGDNGIAYAGELLEIYTAATTAINTAELAYTNNRNAHFLSDTIFTSEAQVRYQLATERAAGAYSAAMDTANVAYAANYQFEIDYERTLLTAELNYLIATGQADANVLNADITNNSTSQEIYDAAYADARVAWMQYMKQPTIAYHVGILTADLAANHQYATTSAAENIDLWVHYMQYVLTTAEAEKQLAIMDTATANAYDLAETLAENAWYLETDRLEYNRLIELWKIEKTRAIEVATLEDQYRRMDQPVPAVHETEIEDATVAAIEKVDASWSKKQIVADETYTDAMLTAYWAAEEGYEVADEAYYGRIRSAFKVQQAKNDGTYEDFDPQYELIESGYMEAVATAAGAYYDAFFTVMTMDSVSNLLPDSPYMGSLRWLWATTESAWQLLRDVYIDNFWQLNDNYNNPTDALFALLYVDEMLFQENETFLDDQLTSAVATGNPFTVYQLEKLSAETMLLYNAMSAHQAYTARMSDISTTYRNNLHSLSSDYQDSIQESTENLRKANEQLEINQTMEMLGPGFCEGLFSDTETPSRDIPDTKTEPLVVKAEFQPDNKICDDYGLTPEELREIRESILNEKIHELTCCATDSGIRKAEITPGNFNITPKPENKNKSKEELDLLLDVLVIQWHQGFVRQVEWGHLTQKREAIVDFVDTGVNIVTGPVGDLREAKSDFSNGRYGSGTINLGFAASGIGGTAKGVKKLWRVVGKMADAKKLLKLLKPIAGKVNIKLAETWKLLGEKMLRKPDEVEQFFTNGKIEDILKFVEKHPNSKELREIIAAKLDELEKVMNEAAENAAKKTPTPSAKPASTAPVPKKPGARWVDDSSPENIRTYSTFQRFKNGCEDYAEKKLEQLGGGTINILTPTRNPGITTLPNYHGKGTGWYSHYVVVKDGKVYDRFTGPNGVSLEEFYSQWDDFFEEITMKPLILNGE